MALPDLAYLIIKKVDKRRETINGNLFTKGDYAIAVEWFDRSAEDAAGLTFVSWTPPDAPEGVLVVNSSELRAVQGHQKNDFILNPINPPKQRAQKSRSAKGAKVQELVYPPTLPAKSGPWTLTLTLTLGEYARPRESLLVSCV